VAQSALVPPRINGLPKEEIAMVKRLDAALGELRAAVFEAYAAIVEEGAKTGTETAAA